MTLCYSFSFDFSHDITQPDEFQRATRTEKARGRKQNMWHLFQATVVMHA